MAVTSLNRAQQLIVDDNHDKLLCLAGAGTGKTFTIIEKMAKLVETGIYPRSILALTFTNVAAKEMEQRYRKRTSSQITPKFYTFHGYCYSLLKQSEALRSYFGYTKVPQICTEDMSKFILETSIKQTGQKISKSKMIESADRTPKEEHIYRLIRKGCDRLMKKYNVITFDELCSNVCKLFANDHDVIRPFKSSIKYIFVDEFQDTDLKQFEFVESLTDAKKIVVGDALQALYSFRGAHSEIIKALAKDDTWHTIKMGENYRSTINICNYANMMSVCADSSARIPLKGQGSGEDVRINIYCESWNIDMKVIDDIVDQASKSNSVAVLVRTNREVDEIVKELSKLHDIHVVSNQLKQAKSEIVEALNLISEGRSEFQEYIKSKSIGDQIDEILQNMFQPIHRHLDMWQMICDKFDVILPRPEVLPSGIDNILQTMIALIDVELTSSGVYVGTVHSSKGLEYDRVILYGVGGKSWRLTTEDNNNLYYVGITRAKNHLTVWKVGEVNG